MDNIPEEILEKLRAITAKRAKTVIDHILEHGYITTEELKEQYGYDHPPRAARDVRERGVPLVTFRVEGTDGKKIAAYKLGPWEEFGKERSKVQGRMALDRKLKKELIKSQGEKCALYNEPMKKENLQVDHRIPYEIGGEMNDQDIEHYQLLSASANSQKNFACKHCPNWKEKDIEKCRTCFYAYPENHRHIACEEGRVLTIVFKGDERRSYDLFLELSQQSPEEKIKELIRKFNQEE
ncbi:MAG: HNH endonuclease [Lentisphaeria bacterium]|nr:HNH endonuclease [Lentisphaeria bacterium]